MEKFKQSMITYFTGVRAEWGKVVWPEKSQVIAYFFAVLVVCAAFTLLIFCLDLLFEFLFGFIPSAH